jgi:pimeloyl-ACP methyl ester carboxylesterase
MVSMTHADLGCLAVPYPAPHLRSKLDFWCRPDDSQLLAEYATDAPVRVVTIPGATHVVHFGRPSRGRDAFLQAVLTFPREG